MEEKVYYEIIEYAKKLGEKIDREIVPSHCIGDAIAVFVAPKGYIEINPFAIEDISRRANIDWRDVVDLAVLREHLRIKLYYEYPKFVKFMDSEVDLFLIYKEYRRKEITKMYRVFGYYYKYSAEDIADRISDIFEEHYIYYIMMKELYREQYKRLMKTLKKIARLEYKDIISEIERVPEYMKPIPLGHVLFFIILLADRCIKADKIIECRDFVRKHLVDFTGIYYRVITLLKKITSMDTLIESFKEMVKLAEEVLLTMPV